MFVATKGVLNDHAPLAVTDVPKVEPIAIAVVEPVKPPVPMFSVLVEPDAVAPA